MDANGLFINKAEFTINYLLPTTARNITAITVEKTEGNVGKEISILVSLVIPNLILKNSVFYFTMTKSIILYSTINCESNGVNLNC